MNRFFLNHLILITALLGAAAPARALVTEGNHWPINLGITGVRADLKPNAPTTLVVVEVMPGTPAAGKLQTGDRIVGVNGRLFTVPHKFGYGMNKFGYEGPLMDVGNALEDSQGPRLNGEFSFLVADGSKPRTVSLRLPTRYGQFAKTYPFDCPKTDRILNGLYAFLIQNQKDNGDWSGRPHLNAFAALALLASGEKQHLSAVKRAVEAMAKSTDNKIEKSGGLPNWRYTLYGMVLAEYYLATGEKWVLPELEEIRTALQGSQFMMGQSGTMRNGKAADRQFGGWGHNPGYQGYGPIAILTGQGLAAYGLMMQCDIPVNSENYRQAHEFLLRGTNAIGYVWYADGNGGKGYADMGRTGISAIAHTVSPTGDRTYLDTAVLNARCIGSHTHTFFDTHGSPILGMGWTALGAAAHPDSFRQLMDDHVWFFNLSQNPNGTFYYMPNRDDNSQDYGPGNDLPGTAVTALILATKYKSLRIMGAKIYVEGVSPSRLTARCRSAFQMLIDGKYASAHQQLTQIRKSFEDLQAKPAKPEPATRSRTPAAPLAVADITPEEEQAATEAMLAYLDKRLAEILKWIDQLDQQPDVCRLSETIEFHQPAWKGTAAFDDRVRPVLESFRTEPRLSQLRQGLEYQNLLTRVESRPNTTNLTALKRFIERYSDSFYASEAREVLKVLETTENQKEAREKFFEDLRSRNNL